MIQYAPVIAPDQIYVDSSGLRIQIKQAVVSLLASTADQTVVAAVSGKKIRVLGMVANTGGASSVATFKGAAAGTTGLSVIVPTNTSSMVLPLDPHGWVESPLGAALLCSVGAVAVTVSVRYIEYTPTSD